MKITINSKLSSPNVSHLTDEQIESVHSKIEFCAKYLEKVNTDLAAKNKWDEPGYTNAQIEKALSECNTGCHAILNTPKPKPPVVEPTPEAAAATADVEMKPETPASTDEVKANELD